MNKVEEAATLELAHSEALRLIEVMRKQGLRYDQIRTIFEEMAIDLRIKTECEAVIKGKG